MTTQTAFWDKAAPKYAKSPIRDTAAYEQSLERTRSYLRPTDRLLEFGCGTGSTALLLSDCVANITATDISPGMIDIARTKATDQGIDNVAFWTQTAEGDFARETPYDVVMALNLLHLIEDLDGALANIRAQTAEGGLFISKTVCMGEMASVWKLVLPIMQFFGKAPFVRFMKIQELEQAIEGAGYKIIETGNYPVKPPSRYIVARKL